MNNFEFFSDLLLNFNLFIELLFCSILIHYVLFRRIIQSILDPYLLAVFASVFSFTDVVFMYSLNKVQNELLIHFLITQTTFFLGLVFFRRRKVKIHSKLRNRDSDFTNSNRLFFYFFTFTYLVSQGIIYLTKGIPILMASRLETFSEGTGEGVLGRITEVTSIIAIYSFFLINKNGVELRRKIFNYLLLILIFITFVLSGSKSSFLLIAHVFWCFNYLMQQRGIETGFEVFVKKNRKKIVLFSIALISLIVTIQSKNENSDVSSGEINPLLEISLRFVYSGDIYWYAYPNKTYEIITRENSFMALFSDFLGLFRIYNWDKLPEVIGLTLKKYHHPSEIITGSNARHNIFGLVYFGYYGSILFSFCLGTIISFIRNRLPNLLSSSLINGAICTYLIIKISGFDTDPQLTLTYLNNLLFIFPVLYLIYRFIDDTIHVKNTTN